jgi:hypothetical protein
LSNYGMWNVGIAGKNRELTVHAASGRTAARPAMVAVPHDARARGEALIVINLAGRGETAFSCRKY